VAGQALRASQESNSALTHNLQAIRASTTTLEEDLEAARAFTAVANQEMSSKSTAFDELVFRERDAQSKLQALSDEKTTQYLLLETTLKMLSEHDYSSSMVIYSAVSHAVAILKSCIPDLDP
jgi:hypothetical protein